MQPVPDSGDGNPPGFSAGNAGKSQKQELVIPAVSAGVNDSGAFWPKSLTPMGLTGDNIGTPANGVPPQGCRPTPATAPG